VAAQREEARVCFGLDLVIKRRWREWLRLAWPWGKGKARSCMTLIQEGQTEWRWGCGVGFRRWLAGGGFFFSFVLLSSFGANKGRQEGFRKDIKTCFKDFKN
jgi:hypothetical protein